MNTTPSQSYPLTAPPPPLAASLRSCGSSSSASCGRSSAARPAWLGGRPPHPQPAGFGGDTQRSWALASVHDSDKALSLRERYGSGSSRADTSVGAGRGTVGDSVGTGSSESCAHAAALPADKEHASGEDEVLATESDILTVRSITSCAQALLYNAAQVSICQRRESMTSQVKVRARLRSCLIHQKCSMKTMIPRAGASHSSDHGPRAAGTAVRCQR
jgi:hypothetical protein